MPSNADLFPKKNGKGGWFQFGFGQIPPCPGPEDPLPIRQPQTCRIIDSDGEALDGPCPDEFFARALSKRARAQNVTIGTAAIIKQFSRKFNGIEIINDDTDANVFISFSMEGNPAATQSAVALANNTEFFDAHHVYPKENRFFSVFSNSFKLVSDLAATPCRITLYFP